MVTSIHFSKKKVSLYGMQCMNSLLLKKLDTSTNSALSELLFMWIFWYKDVQLVLVVIDQCGTFGMQTASGQSQLRL